MIHPVTGGKDHPTTMKEWRQLERQLTPGKTGPGCVGPARLHTSSQEVNPTTATSTHAEQYPSRLPRGRAQDSLHPLTQSQPGKSQRPTTSGDHRTCKNCGKQCLNEKGLAIHIGRMRCGSLHSSDLRKGKATNKTVEELNPESNHSVQSLIVSSEAERHQQSGESEIDSQVVILDRDSETDRNYLPLSQELELTEAERHEVEELLLDPFPYPEPAQTNITNQTNKDTQTTPKPRIKWPGSTAKKQWNDFEEDALKTLQTVMIGSPDKQQETLTTILYSMGKD